MENCSKGVSLPGGTDRSVIRSMTIIRQFIGREGPLGISEISLACGLPKSTVHRIVSSLCFAGMLEADSTIEKYRLGPMACSLARASLNLHGQEVVSYPELMRLATRLNEEVNLGVPVADGIVYVQKIQSDRPLRIDMSVGSKVPFHCTALGKAYLANIESGANLPQDLKRFTNRTITDRRLLEEDLRMTRQRGYSIDREEFLEGVTCVGSVIVNGGHNPVAAVAIQAPTVRMNAERTKERGLLVLELAANLSREFKNVAWPR